MKAQVSDNPALLKLIELSFATRLRELKVGVEETADSLSQKVDGERKIVSEIDSESGCFASQIHSLGKIFKKEAHDKFKEKEDCHVIPRLACLHAILSSAIEERANNLTKNINAASLDALKNIKQDLIAKIEGILKKKKFPELEVVLKEAGVDSHDLALIDLKTCKAAFNRNFIFVPYKSHQEKDFDEKWNPDLMNHGDDSIHRPTGNWEITFKGYKEVVDNYEKSISMRDFSKRVVTKLVNRMQQTPEPFTSMLDVIQIINDESTRVSEEFAGDIKHTQAVSDTLLGQKDDGLKDLLEFRRLKFKLERTIPAKK